ncbi:hypothetical protein H4R33_004571 [Dimargaris cristalligena]|nr:hypothetical protein H4R33_004571 [Dimargaris cristalligena]
MLRGLLIDLSGTLHIDEQATPGAIAALGRLRGTGLRLLFCTNTTKESPEALLTRLHRIGFTSVQPTELFTSLQAAQRLVQRRKLNPLLFLDAAAQGGFRSGGPNNAAGGEAVEEEERPKDAVVVGLSPADFHYDKLNEAFRLIQAGAPLIAIHKARYYARPDGLALGPGGFVAALEYATGIRAKVVGKPEPAFFQLALAALLGREGDGGETDNPAPGAGVAIIGDDAEHDLGGGAVGLGFHRVLVRTGKYRPGDEHKVQPEPDWVCDTFADAVDRILNEHDPQMV